MHFWQRRLFGLTMGVCQGKSADYCMLVSSTIPMILLVMIITVSTQQVMLQTMLVKCLEVQTLNQTDIHDPATFAGKR